MVSKLPACRALWIALSAAALMSTPALAEKPSWAGGGKNEMHERGNDSPRHAARDHGNDSDMGGARRGERYDTERRSGSRDDYRRSGTSVTVNAYFGDRERRVVRDYYADEFRGGNCPPGLAKKQNGCMPPGLAKKWSVGHRLPADVIFYDLPAEVVVRLGVPPSGHKYVRVAADILLIAVGTGMVVDAIEDLSRM
jgi:Ni/Co efflux regulator RcnB